MKIKLFLVILTFLLSLVTSSMVFAENVSLSDGVVFELPDNFKIKSQSKNQVIMYIGDDDSHPDCSILLRLQDNPDNKMIYQHFRSAGYSIEDIKNVKINGIEVTEFNTIDPEDNQIYSYPLTKDNEDYLFTVSTNDDNWDVEDVNNPLNKIITSLHKE